MKINSIKFSGVIPVVQYGNIQPEIEISDVGITEGTEFGLSYIKDLFARFSEKGALNDKKVTATQPSVKQTITLSSFNEPGVEVEFEPIAHIYSYKGVPLVSATKYIEQFYKKFDSDYVSSVSAKAWGVDQQEVKSLWEENGKLSSSFGTLVHSAIEFYHKFKKVGNAISDKKGLEDNYALPKHPVLRSIIEGYIDIDDSVNPVESEVLITDVAKGICGRADMVEIIDLKKKICRIKDIKVNVNSADIDKNMKALVPYEALPANKITKYQLQMSIYGNMLEQTGWTVTGADAFVYEDEWKKFSVDILPVIINKK